jgi:hypothetical protein
MYRYPLLKKRIPSGESFQIAEVDPVAVSGFLTVAK